VRVSEDFLNSAIAASGAEDKMALTKKDKEDIGQIVDEKITREIGSLRFKNKSHFVSGTKA